MTQTPAGFLQKVSSFLPELLIHPLNEGDIQSQGNTYSNSFEACLLFADISGFTALAEQLDGQGPEGAEALTLILNRYFGSFIDLVYAYGGDVAKFAGDALLAVWPVTDDQPITHRARQVQACGQALQDFMANQPPVQHGIQLKMKVAISQGQLHMACIGGLLNRREMVISSPALAELGHANDQAQGGDLIVCPSIASVLKSKADRTPPSVIAPRPMAQLNSSALPAGLEFIPAAIRKSLDANQDAWINENRLVSVLFVNLPGFSGQLAVQATQDCMIALQKSLYSVEGSVNKISVDDKGVSLMGCLGMPPFSHADDPERAVKAALMIHQELQTLGLSPQIGISTGRVFCGVVGQARRREYTMMGDAVNLSARLMQTTQSLTTGLPILMDETTAQACQKQFQLQPFGQVTLKGKQKSVAVYQPVGEVSGVAPIETKANLFVGRRDELLVLKGFLQARKPASHKALLIKAPVGMGRSSLVRQGLLDSALTQHIIEHRCDALDTQLPWGAWQRLFKRLLAIEQCTTPESIQEKVLSELKATGELKWVPLLEAVVPAQWQDSDHTKALTGEARAKATLELLTRLVVFFSAKNTLQWVFYGIEWLDSFSMSLLTELLNQPLDFPLIATTQTETLQTQQDISAFQNHSAVHILYLPPLSESEVFELAAAHAGAPTLPEPAGRLIVERSGGSPLFVTQATNALLEGQFLRHDAGTLAWHPPASGLQSALPASLNGLILSRIDKLAPEIQLTGKVASVIGHEANLDHVEKLHPMKCPQPTLLNHQDTLSKGGLVKPHLPDPGPLNRLEFSNEAIEQAFYDMLPGFQRRTLHRHLAILLAAQVDHNNPLQQAQLARHWYQSIEPGALNGQSDSLEAVGKASSLYLKLAQRAVALGASAEAESTFRTALKLIQSCADHSFEALEVDALLGLSTVRSTRFGWADKEAEQALESALRKSNNGQQTAKVFQAVRGLWQVKVANSDYASAMKLAQELFDRASENTDSGPFRPMMAEAKRALGTTYFWIGEFDQSQTLLNDALSMSNTNEALFTGGVTLAQDTEVSARGILAWAYALQGKEDLALEQAKQAVEVSEGLDSEFTRAYARGAAMWTCLHVSDVAQALHFSELTLQLSQDKGYHYFTTAARVVRGWAKAWQGDENGIADISKAISDWADQGQTIGMPAFYLQLARALEKFNRLDEAAEILQRPLFVDTLPKEPWIEHLARKMLGARLVQRALKPNTSIKS